MDPPASVDQPPGELNFLMAVEQIAPVPAGVVVRLASDRARAAKEEGDLAATIRMTTAETWHVPPRRLPAFVHQSERHRAETRVGFEHLDDRGTQTGRRHGIIVEEAHDRSSATPDSEVPPTGDAKIAVGDDTLRFDEPLDGRGSVPDDESGARANRLDRTPKGLRPSAGRQHYPCVLQRLHWARRYWQPPDPDRLPVDRLGTMVSVAHQNATDLRDVQARAPIPEYLRGMWIRRGYVWNVAVNELRHRQVTNVLGNLWHLLNPALNIGVYYLIFGLLLKTDRGVDNFFLFLTIGIFVFQFTQKVTTDGAKSIVTNKGVIKAIRFPRALLPLTSTVTELLSMLPNLAVIAFVAVITGEPLDIRWLWVVPLLAVQFVFSLGAALVAARMTTHFIDTLQILPFVFRLLLYGSGVIFSVDAYVERGGLVHTLFVLNPMYCYISIARWAIMGTHLRGDVVLSSVVWALAIVVVGFLWFRGAEEQYARD